jgi:thioredoxin-like negative regulator of GroEL
MTIKRFLVVLLLALVLQGMAFAVYYDDLLYLRKPVPALVNDPQTFEHNARLALNRSSLTRVHLDTIAAAAKGLGDATLEVQALERRAVKDPRDRAVRLRLADALRRAGNYDGAEREYQKLLAQETE